MDGALLEGPALDSRPLGVDCEFRLEILPRESYGEGVGISGYRPKSRTEETVRIETPSGSSWAGVA